MATSIFAAEQDSLPRYQINATLDASEKTISAVEKVVFTNSSSKPVDSVYFHIYPNRHYTQKEKDTLMRYAGFFKVNPFPEGFQNSKFEIVNVKAGGVEVASVIEEGDATILRVPLAAPLAPGATTEIVIDFKVALPHAYGRFGWNENVIALARWYPILSVLEEDGWKNYPFYPFHRPFYSEAAYYQVELTLDAAQTVVHTGVLQKEESLENGIKKLTIDTPLPVRDFALAVSADYQYVEEKLNETTIRSYFLPGGEKHARKALASAKDMMSFYGRRFVEYPYPVFNLVPVYLGYGGEQVSNMAFFDTRVYGLPAFLDRYLDFLIAHETGHQWFYNLLGSDGFKEMWIEEGIHSYFLQLYIEEKYGKDAEIAVWPHWLEDFKWLFPKFTFTRAREVRYKMISRIGLDHEVLSELSSFMEPSSIFSVTYGKGSRIAGMLHDYVGDEAFLQAFQKMFTDYRFKNIHVDEVIGRLEKESGRDLQNFAGQWLRSDGYFDAAVQQVKDNKVTLRHRGEIRVPVAVQVLFTDGTKENIIWDSRNNTEELAFEKKASIRSVTIDPNRKRLDYDLTNNFWPRNFNVIPVPFYFKLYDVPVFVPDDGYNLVFGPEFANGGPGVKVSLQQPYDQQVYAATDYEFSEGLLHSRIGYQLSNIFRTQTALGFEIANRTDYDGDEDLVSGKVFLRRELWPVQYGLSAINDHVTLYLLRNRGLEPTLILGGSEDARNLSYLKREEAIAGVNFHLERATPYPDPHQGFKTDIVAENSGHFLGATQHFTRASVDTSLYTKVTPKTKLAFRLKYGGGFPDDKNLFQLGGMDGLRGYDRKEVRGASALLGSVEYRFPLKEGLRWSVLDNAFSIESLGGVVFFDAGEAWYSSFEEASFKKDAGLGVRATVNIGSYFEKVILRADVAQAIADDEEEPRFWFGINHAF